MVTVQLTRFMLMLRLLSVFKSAKGSNAMIKIKTAEQIEAMKPAGALSKLALREVGKLIKPGVTTAELDARAEEVIRSHGGTPTFKGYGGFPASICCSVNSEIVHGIPSQQTVLAEGDIVSIDTGATVNGWVGDNAWTFYCGSVSSASKALCQVTRDCLIAGIAQAVPGNRIGDIGHAVQELAEASGYSVVRDYVGHGVGRVMHEEPNVPNYGKAGRGVKLQAGMVIAIEPMICEGDYTSYVLPNRWTVVTRDGMNAAHYENTIAITNDGPVVLTQDNDGPWCSMQGSLDLSDLTLVD